MVGREDGTTRGSTSEVLVDGPRDEPGLDWILSFPKGPSHPRTSIQDDGSPFRYDRKVSGRDWEGSILQGTETSSEGESWEFREDRHGE